MRHLCVVLLFIVFSVNAQTCSNNDLVIEKDNIARFSINNAGATTIHAGTLNLKTGLDGFQLVTNDGAEANVGQWSSIVSGADNLPIISFYDATNRDLKVAKCKTLLCNTTTIFTVDHQFDVGQFSHIIIGSDNLPFISYYELPQQSVKVARCLDASCSNAVVTRLETGGVGRFVTSIRGSNGFPILAYYSEIQQGLRMAFCSNLDCSSATFRQLTVGNATLNFGTHLGMTANPADGLPVVSMFESVARDLYVLRCNDLLCNTHTLRLVDQTNDVGLLSAIGISAANTTFIAYAQSSTPGALSGPLKLVRCADAQCSSASTSSFAFNASSVSLAFSTDNSPLIAFTDASANVARILRCETIACISPVITQIDGANTGGQQVALTIAVDNLGLVSYFRTDTQDLRVAKCTDTNCAAPFSSTAACCDRTQISITRGGSTLFTVDDVGSILSAQAPTCDYNNFCDVWESASCTDCKRGCAEIYQAGVRTSGFYTIISSTNQKVRVMCDMERLGGGWTLISKLTYSTGHPTWGAGFFSPTVTWGNVDNWNSWNVWGVNSINAFINSYKMADVEVRSVIGPDNNFDIMVDQIGNFATTQTLSYTEVAVIRNYTAVYNFATNVTAASSTPIRISTFSQFENFLILGNATTYGGMSCGYVTTLGTRGISCFNATSPICVNSRGTPSGLYLQQFWHNSDNYFYMCGGYHPTSSTGAYHRWWVRNARLGL